MAFRETIKTSKEFEAALTQVHLSQSNALSDADCEAIKKKVAAMYNRSPGFRNLWNFGMIHDEVHREISRRIPNYDKFDSDGLSEQLYFFTLREIPSIGRPRRVLEVGCGQGGGLNFLSRMEGESKFVGLDLSHTAIERAISRFARPQVLDYLQGDAENLPFEDGEFDCVINLESSHNYPNLGKFISEVGRVLKPGGHFSHVDLFTKDRRAEMESCKQQSGKTFRWVKDQDIAPQVRHAITKRMDPNSLFRSKRKQSLSLPARWFMEPLEMFAFGSYFVDSQSGIANRLYRLGNPKVVQNGWHPYLVDSYRHSLAVKLA